jgi:ribonuclease VapC
VIVVDTSALLGIIQKEPECSAFLAAIRSADRVFVSALTLFEASMVLHARRGIDGTDDLADLVDAMGISVVSFDAANAHAALDAFRAFGKGIHPKARLNLGDCAAYALAKSMNAPLLFKGNDFAATDIVAAHT